MAQANHSGGTWMKNHPLEGDDVVTGFYNFLTKKNPKSLKPCRHILVPDTIVYEHNFPRGWYTTDIKAAEVTRKQGKELDSSTIEKGFIEGIPDECPIVAQYLCTQETDLGNGETETKTLVEVFNKNTIGEFIGRKTKREGILQKFIMPKGYYNSVIQAIWSPRLCMVHRRTNKYPILDRKRAEADPFCSTVTYDGPTFLSEEATLSGNVSAQVKKLCGYIVQHFYYTEHKFITRMVAYFKTDTKNRIWFLWCGSLRVADRNTTSELPVNLVTNFSEPPNSNTFNEERLLQDADEAFLRVTNDEMFFERYMRYSGYDGLDDEDGDPNAASRNGRNMAQEEEEDEDAAEAEKGFDWSSAPLILQETHERFSFERESLLSLFDDLFYNARSHFLTKKNEAYELEVPSSAVYKLTENGVVDLMRFLHLTSKGTGSSGMRYVIPASNKVPITKLSDEAEYWINEFYDEKDRRLQRALSYYEHDAKRLESEIKEI